MQTQKDHVHAYQTLVGRMSSALLLGDTNQSEPPARRALMGLVFGLVLALLIGIAFWVYGLLNPGGNTSWKKPQAIVVEEESGALYAYRDGVLVPVLNHASAMLMQGSKAKIESVSRASLAGVPRAPSPVGIPGAPMSVPDPGSLLNGPWLLCLPRAGGGALTVNIDAAAAAAPVAAGEYLWVASPEGTQYVVWRDQKLRLADPSVPLALGLGAGSPVAAAPEWLSALPDGPVVAAASIPGGAKVTVGGAAHDAGTVFVQKAGNGAEHYFVLRADGLAPMTVTEAALSQARQGKAMVDIDAVAITSAPRSADRLLTTRLPDLLTMKAVTAAERGFCLRQQPRGTSLTAQAVTVEPGAAGAGKPGSTGMSAQPGTGVLAASVPAPTGQGVKPDRYLLTDGGVKYRLADDQAIAALGFGGIEPRPVPADLLARIPSGPVLSREAVGVFEQGRG